MIEEEPVNNREEMVEMVAAASGARVVALGVQRFFADET